MGCQKLIYKPELRIYSSKKLKGRNRMYIYKYRFGFNGMEKDDEVGGKDNAYTTEFREVDVRLGRWLSRDLVVKPWESSYAGFANCPIRCSDPTGLDPEKAADRSNDYIPRTQTYAEKSYKGSWTVTGGDNGSSIDASTSKANDYKPTPMQKIWWNIRYAIKNIGGSGGKSIRVKENGGWHDYAPNPQDEQGHTGAGGSKGGGGGTDGSAGWVQRGAAMVNTYNANNTPPPIGAPPQTVFQAQLPNSNLGVGTLTVIWHNNVIINGFGGTDNISDGLNITTTTAGLPWVAVNLPNTLMAAATPANNIVINNVPPGIMLNIVITPGVGANDNFVLTLIYTVP